MVAYILELHSGRILGAGWGSLHLLNDARYTGGRAIIFIGGTGYIDNFRIDILKYFLFLGDISVTDTHTKQTR